MRVLGARLQAGVLPSGEAVCCIPTALVALCLNAGGLARVQASAALDAFLPVFTTPAYLRALQVRACAATCWSPDDMVRHVAPSGMVLGATHGLRLCNWLLARMWHRPLVGLKSAISLLAATVAGPALGRMLAVGNFAVNKRVAPCVSATHARCIGKCRKA
jgi:hypothetical protein